MTVFFQVRNQVIKLTICIMHIRYYPFCTVLEKILPFFPNQRGYVYTSMGIGCVYGQATYLSSCCWSSPWSRLAFSSSSWWSRRVFSVFCWLTSRVRSLSTYKHRQSFNMTNLPLLKARAR